MALRDARHENTVEYRNPRARDASHDNLGLGRVHPRSRLLSQPSYCARARPRQAPTPAITQEKSTPSRAHAPCRQATTTAATQEEAATRREGAARRYSPRIAPALTQKLPLDGLARHQAMTTAANSAIIQASLRESARAAVETANSTKGKRQIACVPDRLRMTSVSSIGTYAETRGSAREASLLRRAHLDRGDACRPHLTANRRPVAGHRHMRTWLR